MTLKMEIKGLDETIGYLNAVDLKATKNVQDVIGNTAIAVRDEARSRAPISTGKLKKDIRVKTAQDKLSAEVTYMGKKRAFYGKFIEFGTRFMPARPFLGPAWEKLRPRFFTDITAALDGAHR